MVAIRWIAVACLSFPVLSALRLRADEGSDKEVKPTVPKAIIPYLTPVPFSDGDRSDLLFERQVLVTNNFVSAKGVNDGLWVVIPLTNKLDARLWERIRHLPPVVRLTIHGSGVGRPVGDADLLELAQLESLVELNITGAEVSREGMAALTNLTKLRTLHLTFSQVDEAGLEQIFRMENLAELDLTQSTFPPAALKPLTKLKKLRQLRLRSTKADDEALKSVSRIASLEWLDLGATPITEKGLAELSRLPKLHSLEIVDRRQPEEVARMIVPICEIRSLTYLDLAVWNLSIESTEQLKRLTRLEHIVVNTAGPQLREMKNIQALRQGPHFFKRVGDSLEYQPRLRPEVSK